MVQPVLSIADEDLLRRWVPEIQVDPTGCIMSMFFRTSDETLEKVTNGRRPVTASMALRVARFVETPVDDLLAGKYLSARACPCCGHPPEDFADAPTIVEDAPGRNGLAVIDGGKK